MCAPTAGAEAEAPPAAPSMTWWGSRISLSMKRDRSNSISARQQVRASGRRRAQCRAGSALERKVAAAGRQRRHGVLGMYPLSLIDSATVQKSAKKLLQSVVLVAAHVYCSTGTGPTERTGRMEPEE